MARSGDGKGQAAAPVRPADWQPGTSLVLGPGKTTGMTLEDIRDAGLGWIELAWRDGSFDMSDPDNQRFCEELIARARSWNIGVWSLHLPYGTDWDVSRSDRAGREEAVNRHLQLLALASRWGIRTAVLHPSWEPIADGEREGRLAACRESLAVLAERAASLRIRIAVECLPRTCLGNTAAEMGLLVGADERLGICCDVNHLLKEPPERFIRALGSRIISVHMSDNDGSDEKHWLPGTGVIRWRQVMAALADAGYRGPFLFEARPVTPLALADSWRQLLRDVRDADEPASFETSGYVAITDQASSRIVVLDPSDPDWNGGDAVKWSWSAHGCSGFAGLEAGWGLPTDAKIRRVPAWGGLWMVVTDSLGLAAIVPYPEGNFRKWGLRLDGNLHSAELLPDGNIAVAASTGGWVRVYTSSRGRDSAAYSEYRLPGAHGVQWDPDRHCLWALGDDELVALQVAGTSGSPVLEVRMKTELPTRHGHDLQPVYGDPDRMWVSTGTAVYQYVKSQNLFDSGFPGNGRISRKSVKSVGNLKDGRVVSTVPDGLVRTNTPYPLNDWSTEIVDFFMDDESRRWAGGAIYKARVWRPEYR